MSGGRPRKVRSRPTTGVGGRGFTVSETEQLVALCEHYSLDIDDQAATSRLIEELWLAYGSYCATDAAYSQQVGVADEMRDLDTLLKRAQRVLPLIKQGAELADDHGCMLAAAELTESLHSFPNLVESKTTFMPERERFMHAKRELQVSLARVRLWVDHRAQFVANLELVIDVCQRVEPPRGFTKNRSIGYGTVG